MPKEKTISDYIAKENKTLSFEERAKKFEVAIEPLCKELGIVPSAILVKTHEALIAVPNMKDAWESGTK